MNLAMVLSISVIVIALVGTVVTFYVDIDSPTSSDNKTTEIADAANE